MAICTTKSVPSSGLWEADSKLIPHRNAICKFASAEILCTVPPLAEEWAALMQYLFIPTGCSWQWGEGGLSGGRRQWGPREAFSSQVSHSLPTPQCAAFKTWQVLSNTVSVAQRTESECKQGSYWLSGLTPTPSPLDRQIHGGSERPGDIQMFQICRQSTLHRHITLVRTRTQLLLPKWVGTFFKSLPETMLVSELVWSS